MAMSIRKHDFPDMQPSIDLQTGMAAHLWL